MYSIANILMQKACHAELIQNTKCLFKSEKKFLVDFIDLRT